MTLPLLQTKLCIPPPRPSLVVRARLAERLNSGLHRKLTLVSAPAGFGKTTLLTEWIARGVTCRGTPAQIAWLSLDEGDGDRARFLTYLVAALHTAVDAIGQGLLPALQSPTPVSTEAVLTTLLNELAGLDGCLILILDDYHTAETPGIDGIVAFLLEHLPPTAHLVISSRSDPALPLPRLRGRGQMTEIREADLRFTTDEVSALLRHVFRLPVPPSDVRTLETSTEGWVTGLQLAAVAMQGLTRPDEIARFVHDFSGSHRYIIDYLVEEVLTRQPPETQAFLMRTSILGRLCAPLCDAVVSRSDSARILQLLDSGNLFLVPLDGTRRWYRYHRLFSDLLQRRLGNLYPDEVRHLHSRASRWFAAHESPAEAVEHALAAGAMGEAVGLIETHGLKMVDQGAFTTVQRWIDYLPKCLVGQRPWLCLIHAWASTHAHELEAVEPYLDDALAALQSGDLPADGAEAAKLQGHIAALRACSARRRHDNALAIELLIGAAEYLRAVDPVVRSFADLNLGLAYMDQGDLAEAADALRSAVSHGAEPANELTYLVATSQLAAVLILQGRLHQSAELSRRTIREQLDRHGEPPPTLGMVYLRLAWVLAEWNDIDGFYENLFQAIRLAYQIGYRALVTAGCRMAAWERQLLAGQGRDIQIPNDLVPIVERVMASELGSRTAQDPADTGEGVLALEARNTEVYLEDDAYFEVFPGYGDLARARALAREWRAGEALALLSTIYRSAEKVAGIGLMIEARSTEALICQEQGDLDRALNALTDALTLGEAEGYMRTYLDRDRPMARLLEAAAARGIKPAYVHRLLAAFNFPVSADASGPRDPAGTQDPMPPPNQTLVEPLSPRELEILRLIAKGLSNRQIGERLYLAVSTVKGHCGNIYGKLQVRSRTEAVARARELGIL